jgi:ketosteroid isomerase-like protein
MSAETFTQFIRAINDHDLEALASLMAEDHLFVDSLGNRVQGAKSMQIGWRGYFAMCPDYWVRIHTLLSEGDTVLAVGEAGGTIDDSAWQMPAAWKAIIRGGLLSEWHVFADNKRVYEILAKRSRG